MFYVQWNKISKHTLNLKHVFTSVKGQSGRGGLTLNFTLACQNRLESRGLPVPLPGAAIPIFPGAPHNSIIFHQPLVPLWLSARKRKQTVRMIHDPASRWLHNSVTYWGKKGKTQKEIQRLFPIFIFKNIFKNSRLCFSITYCFVHSILFCQGLYFQYWRERGIWCLAGQGAYKCKCKCNVWSITASPGDDKYALRCRGLCHTPLPHTPIIPLLSLLVYLQNLNLVILGKWDPQLIDV